MRGVYNIGQASHLSGVTAKMIRHYEAIGLLPEAKRTESGYRQYSNEDVHTLRFVKTSRDLGFSLQEIQQLLSLWFNKRRASRDVHRLVEKHVDELNQKIMDLERMRDSLKKLAQCCHGDERPECPILDQLAEGEST